MLEELGLEHVLKADNLRKKWNYLVGKYKTYSRVNEAARLDWPFYDHMAKAFQNQPIIVHEKGEHIWTPKVVERFIQLRAERATFDTKNVSEVFAEILLIL